MLPDPAMRDDLIQVFEQRFGELAHQLASGEISIRDFQIDMREELRREHALQVIAASGGSPDNVSSDDWLKLGSTLRSQYEYLEDFAHKAVDGDLSEAEIVNRAKMYAGTSKVSYWKQATGYADLPTYPGQQQCLGHCGCSWVDNGDGTWTWDRTNGDSCPDCIHNSEIYNPYVPEGEAE